jgi:protein transport protein SEC24
LPGADGKVVMPPALELGSEKLDRRGVFLMSDSRSLYLWVGSAVSPEVLQSLFGISSLQEVDSSSTQLQLVRLDNEYSQRVSNVVDVIRKKMPGYQQLHPCKERDQAEAIFFSHLIHDRTQAGHSYPEFLREIQRVVMTKTQR